MEPLENVIEPVSAPERRVAAGGWRRAVVGVLLGVAAGALVAAVSPRDTPRTADAATTPGAHRGG